MSIVVFGSIGADLVTTVKDFPGPGETVVGTSFSQVPGGKGANQAVVAASTGSAVVMGGAVGDDSFADLAQSILKKTGVDLSQVEVIPGSTGVATIFVAESGQNSIAVYAGANGKASATSVRDEDLTSSTVVVMQHECPLAENEKLAARAKSKGAMVVLNAAPAYPLSQAALENVDVLIVNESEAHALAVQHSLHYADDMESYRTFAVQAANYFGCAVLLTLGEKGAILQPKDIHDGPYEVSAPAVNVVDTTGAGDAFVGAFAARLDAGLSLVEALPYGIAAGSLACEQKGAQVALSFEQVSALAAKVSVRNGQSVAHGQYV